MFVCVLLCITLYLFSFCNHHEAERKLVALLLLSYRCIVSINVLGLVLTMPWVGLQCVILVFPNHSYLLFAIEITKDT